MTDKATILMLASMISQSHQSASRFETRDAAEDPLEEAELSNGILGSSSSMLLDTVSLKADGEQIFTMHRGLYIKYLP